MSELACPSCGLDDNLTGERRGDVIRITCAACNLVWVRDPSPRCSACGSTEVRAVPQAVWEKSRGNQLSTVAVRTVYLCPACDTDALRRYLDSGTPIPPRENPATGMK